MDNLEAIRRAIEAMERNNAASEPLGLFSPGPHATRKWREWFPGIEIVELSSVKVG